MLSREGPLPLHGETEAHAGWRIPEVASELSCRSWELKGYTTRSSAFLAMEALLQGLGWGFCFEHTQLPDDWLFWPLTQVPQWT